VDTHAIRPLLTRLHHYLQITLLHLTSYIIMKHLIQLVCLLLIMSISTSVKAQDADKLYKEGKALYDKKAYKEAVPKLQAAANKGHKKAQYRLGRCYDKGNGVAEDEAKAYAWYAKSAAQNYHKAQYQLGRCYKKGKGVAKDHKKAVRYFLLSARQDNADAQLALAKCYLKGKGVEEDHKKAKQWAVKAVKNEEDGAEIIAELRKDAAAGDEDAKKILTLTGLK